MTSEIEAQDPQNEKKQKKHKNKKGKTLLEQMEFYFSDANIVKDKFLSELLSEREDGFVELSVFLKFNKVKALATDVEEIASAVSKSTFLQVSEDRKFVRRTTPVQINENSDQCTIYVENLSQHVDHEWLKEKFKTFGKVAYVSLPKFRNSGRIKGFAFIEFDSIGAAESACKAFTQEVEHVNVEKESNIMEALVERHSDVDDEPLSKRPRLEQPSDNEFEKALESSEVNEKKRRKRKKKHREKKKSEKTVLKLRVMSKLEWKRYRNKFLTLQKANMAQLKKYLELQHSSETISEVSQKAKEDVQIVTQNQAPEFAPNVIIKLIFEEPIRDAKQLRNEVKAIIGVRYVELKDESVCGYIRCDCEEITKSVLESVKDKGDAIIIQGEEEKLYWEKIAEDRVKKLTNKQKPKKRGFDKIVHRAININMDKIGKHIRFDD